MDAARRKRLAELRTLFMVTEVNGSHPPHDVVAETIAFCLNKKYGRPVVVPRDRRGEIV